MAALALQLLLLRQVLRLVQLTAQIGRLERPLAEEAGVGVACPSRRHSGQLRTWVAAGPCRSRLVVVAAACRSQVPLVPLVPLEVVVVVVHPPRPGRTQPLCPAELKSHIQVIERWFSGLGQL